MTHTTEHAIGGAELQQYVEALCAGAHVTVRDDTALHAGHNADVGHYGGHYKVKVIWAGFEGKNRIQRHRMLMDGLAALWTNRHIHALSLTLVTPEEAAKRGHRIA